MQDAYKQNYCSRIVLVKIARPDSSQNFMDMNKTIDLTCLCKQITNAVVFSNHTHIKRIKKSKSKTC